jgi:membrane protein implicated in regulation of membrane protease activity
MKILSLALMLGAVVALVLVFVAHAVPLRVVYGLVFAAFAVLSVYFWRTATRSSKGGNGKV